MDIANLRIYESANMRNGVQLRQQFIYELKLVTILTYIMSAHALGGGAGFVYSSIRLFAQDPPARCAGRVPVPPALGPLRFQAE